VASRITTKSAIASRPSAFQRRGSGVVAAEVDPLADPVVDRVVDSVVEFVRIAGVLISASLFDALVLVRDSNASKQMDQSR